jgi:hypothetical protein
MKHTAESVRSQFQPHPIGEGVIARIPMNHGGYELSIVGGAMGLYGDGKDTFEVAIFADSTGDMITLPNDDTVQGWVTMEQVVSLLNYDGMNIVKGVKGVLAE